MAVVGVPAQSLPLTVSTAKLTFVRVVLAAGFAPCEGHSDHGSPPSAPAQGTTYAASHVPAVLSSPQPGLVRYQPTRDDFAGVPPAGLRAPHIAIATAATNLAGHNPLHSWAGDLLEVDVRCGNEVG